MIMGIKTIIVLCCIVAGTCAGKAVGSALTARRLYFDELEKLARSLCGDFRFRRTPVCELLAEQAEGIKSGALKKNVSEFIAYANGGGGELKLGVAGFSAREKRIVYDFFASLGRYDLSTQTFVLGGISEKLVGFAENAGEIEKKWAGLAVKLGFLAGACAGILFL